MWTGICGKREEEKKMRRVIFTLITCMFALTFFAPLASAQDHGQVGVFADYFRLGNTTTSFVGLGGRAAFNANRYIGFEAEMNYDFNQVFTENFTTPSGTTTVVRSAQTDLGILHGLFGPIVTIGHGPLRPFVTLKGGFINFRLNPEPASFTTFTSSVSGIRANNVDGVLYPGGGIEGFFGPIGLRLEVGDEIYFNNGAQSNSRISFGPSIRF
jgi:hypothetical protein